MRTLIWLMCFVGAFIATHRPPSDEPPSFRMNDKVLHAVGFALLTGVTAWRFHPARHKAGAGRRFVVMLALLSVYAAVDELTQPPFGRSCELYDWLADMAGAGIGLLVFVSASRAKAAGHSGSRLP